MTTSQKQSQRHKTSIFSEYQNNSNNSISSKQLQLWLQQMAPTSHTSPKFGQDWNLMSTSSRYESDGITFGARMETFESANKQNFLNKANPIIEPTKNTNKQNHHQSLSHPQSFQKLKSSKSYINAMQQLQNRSKTLEQENTNMRKSLIILQEEKRNSLQQSMVQSEEMKSKLFKFEQTEKRIDEFKKQNKKLRDSKNEQSLKLKLMQKSINEQKSKVKTFEQRLEMLSKQNQSLKQQLTEANDMTKTLMIENKQLVIKTQTLENMKQKSTNSILEKYAKALQRIQELELTVCELKNKGNSMEQKNKKVIEEKDTKFFSLLETINGLKLQRDQLSMRLQNSKKQLEQKNGNLYETLQSLRSIESKYSQQNRQLFNCKNILTLKDEKLAKITEKYNKLQTKYVQVKEKLKTQRDSHLEQLKLIKENSLKIQVKEYQSQSEESQEQQVIEQVPQQHDTKMSYFIEQKHHQVSEDTPVQRYDQSVLAQEKNDLEEFTTLAKPLSIIVNAKYSQARIKSQQDQLDKANSKLDESEEQEDGMAKEKYITMTKRNTIGQKQTQNQPKNRPNKKSIQPKQISQENKNIYQKNTFRLQSQSKYKKQQKQKSKQSFNSSNSRKKSLQKSKYIVPSSTLTKIKKQKSNILNNSYLSSHNRSKSSSIEKKKTSSKKFSSVDSKRSSIPNKEILKSNEPTISYQRNQKPHQAQMYMSAEPTRYPSQHPQHYFYTNQINSKRNYEDRTMGINQQFYKQYPSSFNHSALAMSENNAKKALNKALLLEYQEEALKLYQEHQKLLGMSEDQNLSTQQRAQILGRTRQVMNMIDHNTEKIFNLKGKTE